MFKSLGEYLKSCECNLRNYVNNFSTNVGDSLKDTKKIDRLDQTTRNYLSLIDSYENQPEMLKKIKHDFDRDIEQILRD